MSEGCLATLSAGVVSVLVSLAVSEEALPVCRSVSGEAGLLPPHLGPPQQHQHPPVCGAPAGRYDPLRRHTHPENSQTSGPLLPQRGGDARFGVPTSRSSDDASTRGRRKARARGA